LGGYLKGKGQNNEFKGYLELMRDANKKPSKKKKKNFLAIA
jgi:hypothetical protein